MGERLTMRCRNGVLVLMFRGVYYREEVFVQCFPDVNLGAIHWDRTATGYEAFICPKEEVCYA